MIIIIKSISNRFCLDLCLARRYPKIIYGLNTQKHTIKVKNIIFIEVR